MSTGESGHPRDTGRAREQGPQRGADVVGAFPKLHVSSAGEGGGLLPVQGGKRGTSVGIGALECVEPGEDGARTPLVHEDREIGRPPSQGRGADLQASFLEQPREEAQVRGSPAQVRERVGLGLQAERAQLAQENPEPADGTHLLGTEVHGRETHPGHRDEHFGGVA
ncbi:MAG: hypothetical protein Q8P50_07510 [Bacillota bacterium]|nr:hypothetical protein [Bacillota bacterium]